MIFIFAHPPQLPSIKGLLTECDLYAEDLDAAKVNHLLLCRTEGQLAGVVGMEVFGETGLLRSLAVAPAFRERGIGSLLLVRIERFAALQGARSFYLATEKAADFFAARGYTHLPTAEVPESVRAAPLFTELAARGASAMVKPLAARKVPAARRAAGPM
ncbi:amino-acid N-acetyltransferase [Geoalkalibacter ferrihydriticus]|uniref:Amino-acid N-acetyltransferase n=1 Tax=Geoalkalibacter ferrihydriticus TaxID=392333 RepID=A0A1G9UBX7_9BACT|nr:GNAT family N-acetyltransferase [Geoalkalibacter ferrihydriticus]SDM57446.1 amino-acid N-acetyltransferase [Geoalkalibacter ferrihydriticus]